MNSLPCPRRRCALRPRPGASRRGAAPARARCRGRPARAGADSAPARTARRRASGIPAAMPMPLSRTAIVAHRRPRRRRCSSIRPPSGVYLAALLSRLPITCASRTASPLTRSGSSGTLDDDARARARRSPAGWSRPPASRARRGRAGSSFRSILPRVMRDTSSRSSTSRVMCCTWRSISSRICDQHRVLRSSTAAGSRRRCGSARADCAARAPRIARNSSLRRSASSSACSMRRRSAISCSAPRC